MAIELTDYAKKKLKETKKKEAPLGDGMAEKTRKLMKNRGRQLKKQECTGRDLGYDPTSGKVGRCVPKGKNG